MARCAACDQALHQLRLGGVGGRALDSIEDPQAGRRCRRPHVDEPVRPGFDMAGDDVHGPGDVLGLAADSVGHLVILLTSISRTISNVDMRSIWAVASLRCSVGIRLSSTITVPLDFFCSSIFGRQ